MTECCGFSNLKVSYSITFLFPLRAQEAYKRHCEEKFVLDTLGFQKSSERLQDAKARVAIVKAKLFLQVPSGMTEWANVRSHPRAVLN